MAFGGIERSEFGNFRARFVFTPAGNAWSAAIKFNERLVSGKVLLVQLDGLFKFLAGLFTVNLPQPFMVEGTLRIEGDSFFRAGDSCVITLGFVVSLGKEQMDFGIARMLLDG